MVTSATFRHPGPLAISVAQVDEMSGGRVDLGIGAGWFENEHTAYAIPFPPLGERFDRLTEQLEILTGLWTTPIGRDLRLHRHALHASPIPRRCPNRRSSRIRRSSSADSAPSGRRHWPPGSPPSSTCRSPPLDTVKTQFDRVAAAVADAGRPPDSMTYSACFVVCAGRDDAEIARRADAIGREVDELRANTPAGRHPRRDRRPAGRVRRTPA